MATFPLRAVGEHSGASLGLGGGADCGANCGANCGADCGDGAAEGSPAVIANRYELVGRIGRGATGSVYRAFDRTLDREVAIKLLQPGQLEVAEREAQVLAKVTHRNVVTIHDFGEAAGHRYLVLELLEGLDFRAWLRERPNPGQILEHFVEAGRGLSAAHQAGLIHRDFKPSNVILTNEARVVVIDFGLACSLDSLSDEFEPERYTEGTLAYMAPERLAGHHNDERSDQFSFCVALWEALAGSNPFPGDDPLARYRAIGRGPNKFDHLDHLGHGLDLGVAQHVVASLERGMAFDRAHRFSTMEELLDELERPAPVARRRGGRPVLMAIAVAATFLIGWGVTPENASIQEAQSSLDPTAAAALALLESAHVSANEGDVKTAMNDLMYAAQLIEDLEKGSESVCVFAATAPALGDLFLEKDAGGEARMAFAISLRYAEFCESLDFRELEYRLESARGKLWLEENKPK